MQKGGPQVPHSSGTGREWETERGSRLDPFGPLPLTRTIYTLSERQKVTREDESRDLDPPGALRVGKVGTLGFRVHF